MSQLEGEKEILLGNKQLISLFFVVVALLGVFFAGGYMIGRKSVTPAMAGEAGGTASSAPSPARAQAQESEPPRETAPVADVASQPDTSSKAPEAEPERTGTVSAKPEERSQTSEAAPEKSESRTRGRVETTVIRPEAGAIYLQVTALRRPDADNLVHSLREQSFPATLADSSKEGLLRVLVGPYHETSRVAEAKAKLKALGFANAFVQRQ